MIRFRRIASLLALVAVAAISMAPMSGCFLFRPANEPITQADVEEISDVFLIAVSVATIAKNQGKITQEKWDSTWAPIIHEGNLAIDDLYAALARGDQTRAQAVRLTLKNALRRLADQNATAIGG